MALHNALVTDTHPLLFHAAGGRRLSREAKLHFERCERQEAILYIPVVVTWECCLLARVGKVSLEPSPLAFFETLFSNQAYQSYNLTSEQVLLAEQVRPNQDPFDALICAAALSLDLPLITRDQQISDSAHPEVVG